MIFTFFLLLPTSVTSSFYSDIEADIAMQIAVQESHDILNRSQNILNQCGQFLSPGDDVENIIFNVETSDKYYSHQNSTTPSLRGYLVPSIDAFSDTEPGREELVQAFYPNVDMCGLRDEVVDPMQDDEDLYEHAEEQIQNAHEFLNLSDDGYDGAYGLDLKYYSSLALHGPNSSESTSIQDQVTTGPTDRNHSDMEAHLFQANPIQYM